MLPSVFRTKQTVGSTIDGIAVLTLGGKNPLTKRNEQVETQKGGCFLKRKKSPGCAVSHMLAPEVWTCAVGKGKAIKILLCCFGGF